MGYNRVTLEVDYRELMCLLQDGTSTRSTIGGLCFNITEIDRSFVEFSVVWIGRLANSVAHHCACMVTALERSFFWLDDIPDWLSGLAAIDCTSISD